MILCTTLRGDVPVPSDYVTFDPGSGLDPGRKWGILCILTQLTEFDPSGLNLARKFGCAWHGDGNF